MLRNLLLVLRTQRRPKNQQQPTHGLAAWVINRLGVDADKQTWPSMAKLSVFHPNPGTNASLAANTHVFLHVLKSSLRSLSALAINSACLKELLGETFGELLVRVRSSWTMACAHLNLFLSHPFLSLAIMDARSLAWT